MMITDKAFGSGCSPFNGPSDALCSPQNQYDLSEHGATHTKTAANVTRYNPQLVFFDAEDVTSQLGAKQMR